MTKQYRYLLILYILPIFLWNKAVFNLIESKTFILFKQQQSYINNNLNFFGKWRLRYTNNRLLLKNSLIYINIYSKNNIKIKNIQFNNFIGYKSSNQGKIIKYTKNIFNNEYNIKVEFNKCNTYTYSIFGIEIPETRLSSKKHSIYRFYTIKKINNSLYIYENRSKFIKYYYIFDLANDSIKLPHIEISIITLIISQIISFLINFLLVYIYNINYH